MSQDGPKKDAVDYLVRFFKDDGLRSYPFRPRALGTFTPEDLTHLMRVYLQNREEVELILQFVRRHKPLILEISSENIRDALNAIMVEGVMKS